MKKVLQVVFFILACVLWGWFCISNFDKVLTLGILLKLFVIVGMIVLAVRWTIAEKEAES